MSGKRGSVSTSMKCQHEYTTTDKRYNPQMRISNHLRCILC